MSGLFSFLMFLEFIVLPVTAIVIQVVPVRLADITFHDTDPEHAWFRVAQYAESTSEQKFGYPSGYLGCW